MKIGGSATFQVVVDSKPAAEFQWRRLYDNNTHSLPNVESTDQGNVTITSIREEDMGKYQVIVTNPHGNLHVTFSLVPESELHQVYISNIGLLL